MTDRPQQPHISLRDVVQSLHTMTDTLPSDLVHLAEQIQFTDDTDEALGIIRSVLGQVHLWHAGWREENKGLT